MARPAAKKPLRTDRFIYWLLLGLGLTGLVATSPNLTLGQGLNVPLPQVGQVFGTPELIANFGTIAGIVATLFRIIIAAAGAIFIVLILIGGIRYLGSAGNEDETSKAKRVLIDSIIGLMIVLSAWAIGNFILSRLGVGRATDVSTSQINPSDTGSGPNTTGGGSGPTGSGSGPGGGSGSSGGLTEAQGFPTRALANNTLAIGQAINKCQESQGRFLAQAETNTFNSLDEIEKAVVNQIIDKTQALILHCYVSAGSTGSGSGPRGSAGSEGGGSGAGPAGPTSSSQEAQLGYQAGYTDAGRYNTIEQAQKDQKSSYNQGLIKLAKIQGAGGTPDKNEFINSYNKGFQDGSYNQAGRNPSGQNPTGRPSKSRGIPSGSIQIGCKYIRIFGIPVRLCPPRF